MRIERAAGLKEEAAQFVAQIVERGAERQSRFVLGDGLVEPTRLEVRLSQRRVLVRQFCRDVTVKTRPPFRPDLPRPA